MTNLFILFEKEHLFLVLCCIYSSIATSKGMGHQTEYLNKSTHAGQPENQLVSYIHIYPRVRVSYKPLQLLQ